MLKRTFYTLLLAILTSCSGFYSPIGMPMEVPDGPPEFKAGWYDGCRTGLGTKKYAGASVYDTTFGSGIYQHDPVYIKAWGSAFYTCYVLGNRASAINIFSRSPAD